MSNREVSPKFKFKGELVVNSDHVRDVKSAKTILKQTTMKKKSNPEIFKQQMEFLYHQLSRMQATDLLIHFVESKTTVNGVFDMAILDKIPMGITESFENLEAWIKEQNTNALLNNIKPADEPQQGNE